MVSPVDKNGGAIQGSGGTSAAACPGRRRGRRDHLQLRLLLRGAAGRPGASQYISRGGPLGWATENITMPALSGSYRNRRPRRSLPALLRPTSPAACSATAAAAGLEVERLPGRNPPLPGSGAPAGFRNYYLRDNAAGGFRGRCSSAADLADSRSAPTFELAFAGASPDLGHVVLSTCAALTADATEVPAAAAMRSGRQNLYE